MISAQIICDSASAQGKRLTTFKLRYPKFIHCEFMTHRVISRNASSSRAIPVSRLIKEVEDTDRRAGPVWWGAEQKGMESGDELSDQTTPGDFSAYSPRACAQDVWRRAAYNAADRAKEMVRLGVHKSIVNRLLEPFSHINVVATATEWDNFFGLRLDKAAQPEMRTLAEVMWREYDLYGPGKGPQMLKPGDWHIPFIDFVPSPDYETNPVSGDYMDAGVTLSQETAIKVSVARCARVSYQSNETGKRSTIEEDLKLYERLLGAQPLHASPAEHQATPDTWGATDYGPHDDYMNKEEHGNFIGWRQYRKMLPGEAVAPLPEQYKGGYR